MIDQARLENALVAVARRYAAWLIPNTWQRAGDYAAPLSDFARSLAEYGVLVVGAKATDAPPEAVRAWVDAYIALYSRLAQRLFPSYTGINAFYIDQAQPPLVGLQGAALPVIMALGGYAAPFAARVQRAPSEVELRGLLDVMLEELEAGDLPRDDYRALRDAGVEALRQIVGSPVRTQAVTPAVRPVFGEDEPPTAPPPNMPKPEPPPPPTDFPEAFNAQQQPSAPPPPPDLPEDIDKKPELPRVDDADEPPFKPDTVPIFFDPKRRTKDTGSLRRPRPPVPPLPGENKP